MSNKSLKKIVQTAVGVGFFTAGMVVYVLKQLSGEAEKVVEKSQASSAKPKPAPVARPARKKPVKIEKEPAATTQVLPLTLRAEPNPFKRNRNGTIYAETLPGASCTIEAKYSTRRRPTGLDEVPAIAEADGVLEWMWNIGTGGSHVDVVVKGKLRGYEDTEATLQVQIVD